MNETYVAQIVLLATTLATTIVGVASAWLRARREREWAVEDRRLAAEERKQARDELLAVARAEAEALAIKAEGIARALSIENKAMADRALVENGKLSDAVAEVGASAHKAYQEANHVNLKIEQLNARLLASENDKGKANKEQG
jgi:hypothetical protein